MNSSETPTSAPGGPARAHACVLCQQRKVKCSRETPCSGCIKSRAECIYRDPAPPRRRKRRNPEDVLLDRLKRYEELLQNAGIKVGPIGRANDGSAEDDQAEDREPRQTSASDNASRSGGGQHDAKTIPFGESISAEMASDKSPNPGRFIFEEGRSRYLEKWVNHLAVWKFSDRPRTAPCGPD